LLLLFLVLVLHRLTKQLLGLFGAQDLQSGLVPDPQLLISGPLDLGTQTGNGFEGGELDDLFQGLKLGQQLGRGLQTLFLQAVQFQAHGLVALLAPSAEQGDLLVLLLHTGAD